MGDRDDPRELPDGDLTLAFVDVEGSTRLLHALGPRYDVVRDRLRELVRTELAAHRGHEVDWAGDGAFLVFETARDAVEAIVSLQHALASEPWPEATVVRVRVGLHSGEPRRTDDGYAGVEVHAAARICAAAHGGQVVVSRATRERLRDDPPAGTGFRALGAYRLKGFPERQQLFQLVAPGLPDAFPPLYALGSAALPALHHRLVGREHELAEIRGVLARPDERLVTITGPGGAGKSRLGLEVAATLAAERPVHLAGLAPVTDAAQVPAAVARVLGLREPSDVALVDAVAAELAGAGALLVLDNLEHLPAATPLVARLLDGAPDLAILATSRAPLRLAGEHVVRVGPLPVAEASTLFGELAAKQGIVLPDALDADVREICRRLDGLPLAIELVTARLATFPPRELLEELSAGLSLTMLGPVDLPERQRTLRATIDWSYALLSPEQRQLHGALAAFSGGCRLDDARAVAALPAGALASDLEALVDGGLVRSDPDDSGRARISMLETVREYALARLAEEGVLDDLRTRHARRFLDRAIAEEERLAGPEQAAAMEELERDHDNLRAALDWSLAHGEVELALRAVSALGRYWRAHGHVGEARGWLRTGLGLDAEVSDAVRAKALWTEAHQAMAQSDAAAARAPLEEALVLFRRLDDGQSVVFALCELCLVHVQADELQRAGELGEEALATARAVGDARALSAALNTLGILMDELGSFGRARELYAESLALRRELGNPLLVVNSINNLAFAALRSGDREGAEAAFSECLALADELGDAVHRASALCALGELALDEDDPSRAGALLADALAVYEELGDDRMRAECLHVLGGVAAAEGRPLDAARLWGAAESLRDRLGAEPTAAELAVDERFAPVVLAAADPGELAAARSAGLHGSTGGPVGAAGPATP